MADIVQFRDHSEQLERDRAIFRDRVQGIAIREIAEKYKCTIGEIYAAQHRMTAGVTPEFKQSVVELDLARLEAMHEVYFKLAIGGDGNPPDKEAAALITRFMDRRAKYCGLDQMPASGTEYDTKREPSDYEKIREAIYRVARGPMIEGEAVEIPPDKKNE